LGCDQRGGLGRDPLAARVGAAVAGGDCQAAGISRNTVAKALASQKPPKYRRAPKGSTVDRFEPAIRSLLAEFSVMPATVIAERIGWDRSLTVLKDRVRLLRPVFVPIAGASGGSATIPHD
jgi:hypothetical protein